MAEWQNGRMAESEWQNGRMVEWHNCRMVESTEWQNGRMAEKYPLTREDFQKKKRKSDN